MKEEHLLLLSDMETEKLYSFNGYNIIILGDVFMLIPDKVYDVLDYIMFNNCEEFGTRKCVLRLPIILGDDFNSDYKAEKVKHNFHIPEKFKGWKINSNFEIMEILEYLKKKGVVKDIGDIIVYDDYWGRSYFEKGEKDTGKVIGNFNKPETLVDMLKYNRDRDRYFSMDIRIELDRYEAYEAINNYNKYCELINAIGRV